MSILENQVRWLDGIVTQIPKQRNMAFQLTLASKENQTTSGTKKAGLEACTKVTSRMVGFGMDLHTYISLL